VYQLVESEGGHNVESQDMRCPCKALLNASQTNCNVISQMQKTKMKIKMKVKKSKTKYDRKEVNQPMNGTINANE
jgi:hypothetical protein